MNPDALIDSDEAVLIAENSGGSAFRDSYEDVTISPPGRFAL